MPTPWATGGCSIGLAIFVAVASLAEGVMWPAERRLQAVVTAAGTGSGPAPEASGSATDAATLERSATLALVLLVAAIVVMVAQP